MFSFRILLSFAILFTLSSCAKTISDLKAVGDKPQLSKLDPPVTWGVKSDSATRNPNSLWQPGSRDFFKDSRARGLGDILTVIVTVNDSAKMNNATTTTRTTNEDFGMTGLFDLQNQGYNITNAPIVGTTSGNSLAGTGVINRTDAINVNVAAMVKHILPNGNLIIEGTQEIRINTEVRELSIAGIVRQEDISAENSVTSAQIAEARISYGGRGNLSRVQQPRYGSQILDILLPW